VTNYLPTNDKLYTYVQYVQSFAQVFQQLKSIGQLLDKQHEDVTPVLDIVTDIRYLTGIETIRGAYSNLLLGKYAPLLSYTYSTIYYLSGFRMWCARTPTRSYHPL
jgi:hypothetical protein